MLRPTDPGYETDADRKARDIFGIVYPHVAELWCDFIETATLKDTYTHDEAEALFQLGQYVTIFHWQAIRDSLDRALDAKRAL